MKKILFIFFFICVGMGFFVPSVFAVDCSISQSDTVFTLKNDCRFGEAVDGLDLGTGAANTSKLIIPAGKTLTVVDRGSNPQTLVVGSFTVEDGATIIKPEGSKIIVGQPICLTDSDTDGYIDDGVQSVLPFKQSPGATCIRKNVLQSKETEAERQGVDCDKNSATYNTSCASSAVDLTQGSFNRVANTSDPSIPALQDYYQESGKDNGLVGLWHMNETSGTTTVADSSGNSFTGTSASSTNVTDGRIGKARSFNGSSDTVTIAAAAGSALDIVGVPVTLSAWIYPITLPANSGFVIARNYSYGMYIASTAKFYCGGVNLSNFGSTTILPLNQWTHVACVINGSQTLMYINGKLETIGTLSAQSSNANNVYIGSFTGNSYYFNGIIDDPVVYSRALASEEIKAQALRRPYATYTSSVVDAGTAVGSMQLSWTGAGIGTRTYSTGTLTGNGGETPYSTTGLVAQWNLNSTSGTTATNDGGASSCGGTASNCDGTLTNFASTSSQDEAVGTGWTNNNKRWGQSGLMLDGTNDYLSVPDRAILDMGNAMSISMWAYQRDLAINKALIGRWTWKTDGVWALQTDTTTNLKLFIAPAADDGGTVIAKTPEGSWSTGWHHVVVAYDGTKSTNAEKVQIYIDGIQQPLTFTGTIPASLLNSASPIRIGDFGGLNRYWNGQIDAVQLYSRTLNAAEALSIYNAGAIEMQWRAGSTTTPDSSEYAAGTNWTQWAPVGTAGYETQLEAMDSTQASWYWDIASAGNADGTIATNMPKAKVQDTTYKQEGTGSLKMSIGQPQVDANTKGLWHMDETSGTGAYITDSSGNANNGTPVGTSSVDAFMNKGLLFDKSSGEQLDIGSPISLDLGATFTVEAWVKPNALANYSNIVNKSVSPRNVTYSYILVIHGDGTLGSYSAASNWGFSSATGITVGNWYHVAWVLSGGNMYFYVNGVSRGSRAFSYTDTATHNVFIGTSHNAGEVFNFNGIIDEVRMSNNARSADQIAEAYRAGRDHRLSRVITSSDLTSKTKLPFWIASDRLGTFSELTIGESAFANNEPDANTVGLWHLEEQTGAGAYIKDSAGTNHGTPAGTTFTQGKIGRGRYFNGTTSDYISIPNTSGFNFGTGNFSVSAWVNFLTEPTTYVNIMSTIDSGNTIGWIMSTDSGGDMGFWMSNAQVWTLTTVNVPIGWHYWTVVRSGTTLYFYLDGVLREIATGKNSNVTSGGALKMGYNDDWSSYGIYNIDEARVDNIARTASEIRQAYEIGLRTHPITIDFRANLIVGALIDNTSDTAFSVDETAYGSQAKANHLFSGDTIIVKENVGGTEYFAQGVVSTVNSSTGAVTVSSWDTGSTVPTGGFTVNATVFKWQREFMDLTGIPVGVGTGDGMDVKDAITRFTLRLTDTSQGATLWLDDMRAGGPYLNTSPQTLTISPAKQYLQLRALFSSSNIATSSSLNTVNIGTVQPSLTPTPTSIP